MHTKEKTSSIIIKLIIAIIIAIYVLFPFFLVVINSCKTKDAITADPIGLGGASFAMLMENISAVVNDKSFPFFKKHRWYYFV